MSKSFYIGLIVILFPSALFAQSGSATHPVYRRAQALVNDGNVAAGRALVDSMISVARPGSNDHAEGIYWRAVMAPTAAEAEADYRRLVVDYPLSPRVEDSLLRLAQLEIARGNYDGALRHLNRVALEHPASPTRGRAAYWTARALFEKNDVQGGCAATADALARTNENETELRNQINYLNQRCAGVTVASSTPPSVTPAATVPPPIAATDTAAVPRPTTTRTGNPIQPPSSGAGTARTPPAAAATQNPKPRMQPPAKPRDVEPSMVELPATLPPAPASAAPAGAAFSVQVAAYNLKSQAETFAARLRKQGYQARVSGISAPFRVRIGWYATRTEASAVQRGLKAKRIDGFVVQAEPR